MTALPAGRHAVLASFASATNQVPNLARLATELRSRWEAAGVRLAADVAPSPFFQVWRKDNVLTDEWMTYVLAVVEVGVGGVDEARLRREIVNAGAVVDFPVWRGAVNLRHQAVAAGQEARSSLLASPERLAPAGYAAYSHTPRPGEAGYRPPAGLAGDPRVVLPVAVGARATAAPAPAATRPATGGLRPGAYAVRLAAATAGAPLDLTRVQRDFRRAFGAEASRPAGEGVVRLACDAAPQPFVQTFRKRRTAVADEWRVWLLATVAVEGAGANPQRLVNAFSSALGQQGHTVYGPINLRTGALPGAAAELLHVGEVPTDFEPYDHTRAPGEAGFLPLPACAVDPPARLPFLPDDAAPPADDDAPPAGGGAGGGGRPARPARAPQPRPIGVPPPRDTQLVGPDGDGRRPDPQGFTSTQLLMGAAGVLLAALALRAALAPAAPTARWEAPDPRDPRAYPPPGRGAPPNDPRAYGPPAGGGYDVGVRPGAYGVDPRGYDGRAPAPAWG